jgi:very-short-patch-repair endonuclease
VLAACWAGGADAQASGRTGAELYRVPGGSFDPIQIRCRRWNRAQHPGIEVHETNALTGADRAVVDGIPVASIERVLLDLAAESAAAAEAALDDALRRRLTTLTRLDGMLRRLSRQGRPGLRPLRRLVQARLMAASRPTESVAETRVLRVLQRAGLPDPVTQHPVPTRAGASLRVDFAYVDHRIAIEYDSDEFHTGRVATERDARRRHALVAAGWLPIIATSHDLGNGADALVAAVRTALLDRSGVKKVSPVDRN